MKINREQQNIILSKIYNTNDSSNLYNETYDEFEKLNKIIESLYEALLIKINDYKDTKKVVRGNDYSYISGQKDEIESIIRIIKKLTENSED